MPLLERVAELRRLFQDVPFAPDVIVERHHQVFANGIDGRVGDLREHLLEIVEEQLRLVGKTGQGRVRPHRTHRLLTVGGHGNHDGLQVFVGVPEGALPHQDGGVVVGLDARRVRQMLQRDLIFLQPLGIRLARRQLLS